MNISSLFASIPHSYKQKDIDEHLKVLLDTNVDLKIPSEGHSDATPLMIACDKGKINILNYIAAAYSIASPELRNKYNIIFGDCLRPLPKDASNQAIHYTDSVEALGYLSSILCYQRSDELLTEYDSFKCLISQRNDHGDTFVMMLGASGRAEQMKDLLDMCSRFEFEGKEDEFSTIFNMKNESGDSVTTLAYGSGHSDLLDLLLSSDLSLEISHQDITRLQTVLNRTKSVQHLVPNENLETFKDKQNSVRKCLSLIEAHLHIQSEKVANALLSEEESNRNHYKSNHRKCKPKAKVRQRENFTVVCSKDRLNDPIPKTDSEKVDGVKQPLSKPVFLTLPDGSLVSERSGHREMDEGIPVLSILQQRKSLDHLLIERCIPSSDSDITNDEIISMMSSLCLEPAMLLLNPQEMAMKLSPSQLEAVETILNRQLDAITRAREIHHRIMN